MKEWAETLMAAGSVVSQIHEDLDPGTWTLVALSWTNNHAAKAGVLPMVAEENGGIHFGRPVSEVVRTLGEALYQAKGGHLVLTHLDAEPGPVGRIWRVALGGVTPFDMQRGRSEYQRRLKTQMAIPDLKGVADAFEIRPEVTD